MTSRVEALLNRIELVAKKFEMSIEDVVSILEGDHPTHKVTQAYVPVEEKAAAENPTVTAAASVGVAASANPVPVTQSGGPETNPTISGPADASAVAVGQQAAGSIAEGSVNVGVAAQNLAAAQSQIQD